jgi:hypothetical protein
MTYQNKPQAASIDRARVNTSLDFQLDALVKKHGATVDDVKDAVRKVGVMRRNVEAELRARKRSPQ